MESLIGKGEKRIDAYDKVTGKGLYASDYDNQFPNMAHIKAKRSPYAHAKILKIDTSKAQALEGVLYILTGAEPGIDWDQYPKAAVLATDRALWAGQTVALVAAETEELAQQAVDLIDVEYEVLPHVLDYYEAIKPNPVAVIDPDYETRDQGLPRDQPRFPQHRRCVLHELRRCGKRYEGSGHYRWRRVLGGQEDGKPSGARKRHLPL